jgi:hypothetical protein
MKRTILGVCTCLLLGATSSFAQDRSSEQTTPNTAPGAPANGTPNGATPDNGTQGNGMSPNTTTTQNNNAPQSGGDQGADGTKMTRKQCQDLKAREAQKLGGSAAGDKACAKILNSDGNGGDSTPTE